MTPLISNSYLAKISIIVPEVRSQIISRVEFQCILLLIGEIDIKYFFYRNDWWAKNSYMICMQNTKQLIILSLKKKMLSLVVWHKWLFSNPKLFMITFLMPLGYLLISTYLITLTLCVHVFLFENSGHCTITKCTAEVEFILSDNTIFLD